jgi:tRNA-2-methylthio-N6-dimethylallyladenosine synthase
MEGCSKYCTFCVVPYTRGEEVSRPMVDVLSEIRGLAQQGVREVTLLGQNVNAYIGELDDGEEADFALLLTHVSKIEGIERIRYTTSHPLEFTQRLIDAYTKLPKLPSQLHLPVQSGSDRVLMGMRRNYTALQYKSIVRKLKVARPDILLTSDLIVGFPGETEEDFQQTMKLVEDIRFDGAYSFVYSRRPGTPAASMQDDTPQEVKFERLARLQKRLQGYHEEYSQAMLGTVQRVLVEGVSRKSNDEICGLTDNNRTVNFVGDASLIGQFVNLRITEAWAHSLRGELAE